MNKKEIAEIKKQFTPDRCSITRICGCYVDGEKNKKTELKEAFLSLSEEETFKYFDIFRKTLTGTIGKNLINMEFPLDQEAEGGTQNFLMKLRESKLTDDTLTEAFYDKIIENYDYGENYYIILIHAVYDIPGKSSDGAEMFDASDEIYDISSAASARSSSPRQACTTTQRPTISKTVSVTGWWKCLTGDSFSRSSTTAAPTSTGSSTTPKTPKTSVPP